MFTDSHPNYLPGSHCCNSCNTLSHKEYRSFLCRCLIHNPRRKTIVLYHMTLFYVVYTITVLWLGQNSPAEPWSYLSISLQMGHIPSLILFLLCIEYFQEMELSIMYVWMEHFQEGAAWYNIDILFTVN